MFLCAWWNEFLEIVEATKERLLTEQRMVVSFELIKTEDCNKAPMVISGGELEYFISVPSWIIKHFYNDIVCIGTCSTSLEVYRERFNCNDHLIYLQKSLCILIWQLIVSHEVGHIVQGHVDCEGINGRLNEDGQLEPEVEAPTLAIDANKLRSMTESDADAFAGLSLGPVPSFIQFDCPKQEDMKNLGKALGLIASNYLAIFLNFLGDDYPRYPPVRWRAITMYSAFLFSMEQYESTKVAMSGDFLIDPTQIMSDPFASEVLRHAGSDLDRAGYPNIECSNMMKEWLTTYQQYRPILDNIHTNMKMASKLRYEA